MSELILYTSEDGTTRLDLRVDGHTVWLTQIEIAELFQTSKQNISLHAKNIFEDAELSPDATVKDSLTVQTEGKREVQRSIQAYSLDLILAIGYRVCSPRGVQFRQWATNHLREYLVKGFVMDDERLKNPGGWDYFDELLARIREIRASEKRFYQKVRDLFAPPLVATTVSASRKPNYSSPRCRTNCCSRPPTKPPRNLSLTVPILTLPIWHSPLGAAPACERTMSSSPKIISPKTKLTRSTASSSSSLNKPNSALNNARTLLSITGGKILTDFWNLTNNSSCMGPAWSTTKI